VGSAAAQTDFIDRKKMAALIEEEGGVETEVKYVKCPFCQKIMNRRSYGARSGVVADICERHGIWLDGGELGRIFKWAKAGGLLHDAGPKGECKSSEVSGNLMDELEHERECRAEKMGEYFLQANSGTILRTLIQFLK
jgi:Zn-finger nucleic acid-binding protein